MLKAARRAFLILSLLSSAQTWAAHGPCTTQAVEVGGPVDDSLLSDQDLKKAIVCAVNRAGKDVRGYSTFFSEYSTRIDESDLDMIKIDRRNSESEPWFNQKNVYGIHFQAVYGNRILTQVRCEATVEIKSIPGRYVTLTLSECRANNFGNGAVKLEAMAPYTKAP